MAGTVQQYRKVLLLSDEPSKRNLLTLMKEPERENTLDCNGMPVPDATDHKEFDTAILDVRYLKGRPREEIRGVREFRPST